jgi:hypothetical protein
MSKTLAAEQIRLNLVDLIDQAVDPSAGGGVAAAIGSFYVRSGTPQLWQKTGAAATAWSRLAQALDWKSVRDYGAVGDGVTDDRANIQAAIDDVAAAGGGVVYVPRGDYLCGKSGANPWSLLLDGTSGVQIIGQGPASILRQSGNAVLGAYDLLRVRGGASQSRVSLLQFNGSGVINPSTACHLINADGTGGGVTELQLFDLYMTGMVVGAGDAVHADGSAGNLISRLWLVDLLVDGAARYGIGIADGVEYVWLTDSYLTNCQTELAIIAAAADTLNSFVIHGNEFIHTGAVRHAIRIEGDGTSPLTRLAMGHNVILGGFMTLANAKWFSIVGNVETSGAFASTDPVCKISGNTSFGVLSQNVIDRASGASAGKVISVEAAGGNAPTIVRLGSNVYIQETAEGFVLVDSANGISLGQSILSASNPGAGTQYGIDVQAVSADVDDILLQGNQMFSAAGSLAAATRLLVNGANVINVSIANEVESEIEYSVRFEDAGAGAFTGRVNWAGNASDGATGVFNQVGTTVIPTVGFNASTLGPNLFMGTGSPEGVVTARIGSMYLRTDGGTNAAVYYKESGTGTAGWIAIASDSLVFGCQSTGTVATALFMAPGDILVADATEIQVPITRPGTLRNLRIRVATAGVTAGLVTFTVRKNAVDTAIVATIDNAVNGNTSDLVNTTTVVAGDLISVRITKAGAVATGQAFVYATLELS